MGRKAGSVYADIRGNTKPFARSMEKAEGIATRSAKKIHNDVEKNISKSFVTAEAAVSAFSVAAAAAAAAVGYAMGKLAVESIAAASALEEVSSKYSVVFKGQTAMVDKWADNLVEKYAMSTREAKSYLSSVQDLLVPMGMQADAAANLSNEIVKLSADLGSFNDLPTAQVMENIQSALVGEYETMKKYGVVINATIVQQKALNMGLADTVKTLTVADKAQAAYKLMVESSTAAMGDMERTADGYANTTKRLTSEWEDFTAALGERFIGPATKAKGLLADLLDTMTKIVQGPGVETGIQSTISKINELTTAMENLQKRQTGVVAIDIERQKVISRMQLQLIALMDQETILRLASSKEGVKNLGTINDGVEDVNKTLGNTEGSLEKIEKLSKSVADIWGDESDVDYGYTQIDIAVQKMQEARNNEALQIENNIDLQNRMTEAVEDSYADYGTIVDSLYDDIEENMDESTKHLDDSLKKQLDAYEHMYNEVHDIAADFWGDILDGQMDSWDDFMDHMLDSFKKTFAQILADATTPILMNITQSVTGGIGGAFGSSVLPGLHYHLYSGEAVLLDQGC